MGPGSLLLVLKLKVSEMLFLSSSIGERSVAARGFTDGKTCKLVLLLLASLRMQQYYIKQPGFYYIHDMLPLLLFFLLFPP